MERETETYGERVEANERTNALYRIILNASTLLSSCNVLFIVLLLLYCVYEGSSRPFTIFVTYMPALIHS